MVQALQLSQQHNVFGRYAIRNSLANFAIGHNQLIINDLDLPVNDKQYCEFSQQMEPTKVREQQFVLERITEYFKEI
jgi:hypothetical protein